jgi:DNA-binding LacI/PurR family transcriptional regulator
LLLTGAGIGRERKIFADGNRLRIADGCLVLGREFDRAELKRLVTGDYPFVAIGRREDAGGPVPYVGGDYASGTRALVEGARALGHDRLAFIGPNGSAESVVDRWRGFSDAITGSAQLVLHVNEVGRGAAETLDAIVASGASAVFFVELADAVRVEAAARERGQSIPGDFSVVVLGSHVRAERSHVQFTSFNIPREEMGRQATAMLVRRIEDAAPVEQILLTCKPVEGQTLGPVTKRT